MANSGHKGPKSDTLAVHAGQSPDPATGARATPIYQSASFVFDDADHAASLFNMERAGHVYSRLSNPTNAVLEERVAALEGGAGAIATASGQAALHLAIVTLMGQGGHIVASSALYGGSHNLLHFTLPRFGITTTFVKGRDLDAWRNAIRPGTRLLFGETVGNPGLDVLDIPAVSEIAHASGVPLLVDATLTTPMLSLPFSQGADLVFHSATKFLSGHGVVIGGVLVDGGKFDWETSGKYPTLTEPYEGFHGMDFAEESPIAAFLLRARREGLRDFGACMAPMTAFQILQGIETLHVRMPRHVSNARKIIEFLSGNAAVVSVCSPEARVASGPCGGEAPAARRLRRRALLRGEGRARGGAQVHREALALLAPRQHRRRQVAGDPSGDHDALPHGRGGAARGRNRAGHNPAVHRAGAHR